MMSRIDPLFSLKYVRCMYCQAPISRLQKYQRIIQCPSCQQQMIRNKIRLILCYTSIAMLLIGSVLDQNHQWIYSVIFTITLGSGLMLPELVKHSK
ncbi:MAG: hypothetical protein K0U68_08825 [Gammaproteobacteria bacterium]|nr:hypothetical protein [Gammaproteobacteria bacterium]